MIKTRLTYNLKIKHSIIFYCCLLIVGANQLCFGQNTEFVNRILPTDLETGFESEGYCFSKIISNHKMSNLKSEEEKRMLPVNGVIEFMTTRQSYGVYSFQMIKNSIGVYIMHVRHLPNKSSISEDSIIRPFYTKKVSLDLVNEFSIVYTTLIDKFKSKEIKLISFGGTKSVFRTYKENGEIWQFTAINPIGGEFSELTNICYSIIRDCSNNTFDEQKCIDKLEILKMNYSK